ncbi:hypothetical protein [Natrinema halophilum]|uniref:Uncharacterized protein n=1 Tax=Natrinema halophilum TaxID=1699371 RepID=A0A7D5KSQ6_9EURY|nr:hypothetical protein [Natrinema halophilum]QLG50577.1 hypothetical protein HYG82_17870 [Natrinema halophilum]
MIDREGRIVFGSFLLFVLVQAVSIVVERQFGFARYGRPLPSLFLFAGVAVALPQLYLVFFEDGSSPTPRSRLRFAAIATAAFAAAFADGTGGTHFPLTAAVGAGAILGLLCYETLEEFRSSGADFAFELDDR